MKSNIKTVFTALLIFSASIAYGQTNQLPYNYKEQKRAQQIERLKTELELNEEQEVQYGCLPFI